MTEARCKLKCADLVQYVCDQPMGHRLPHRDSKQRMMFYSTEPTKRLLYEEDLSSLPDAVQLPIDLAPVLGQVFDLIDIRFNPIPEPPIRRRDPWIRRWKSSKHQVRSE